MQFYVPLSSFDKYLLVCQYNYIANEYIYIQSTHLKGFRFVTLQLSKGRGGGNNELLVADGGNVDKKVKNRWSSVSGRVGIVILHFHC